MGAAASCRLLERVGAGDVSAFGFGSQACRRERERPGLRERVGRGGDRHMGLSSAGQTGERRAGGGGRRDVVPVGAGAGSTGREFSPIHYRHELQPAGVRASWVVDHRILSAARGRTGARDGWSGIHRSAVRDSAVPQGQLFSGEPGTGGGFADMERADRTAAHVRLSGRLRRSGDHVSGLSAFRRGRDAGGFAHGGGCAQRRGFAGICDAGIRGELSGLPDSGRFGGDDPNREASSGGPRLGGKTSWYPDTGAGHNGVLRRRAVAGHELPVGAPAAEPNCWHCCFWTASCNLPGPICVTRQ